MKTQTYSEYYSFLRPWGCTFLCGAAGLLILGFALFLLVLECQAAAIFFSVIAAIFLLIACIPTLKYNHTVRGLKKSGELPWILADFENSRAVSHDDLLFGDRYIFPAHGGKPIAYEDITQIYQHVTYYEPLHIEQNRKLMCLSRVEGTIPLCSLAYGGKSDEAVCRMVDVIRQKKPGVRIGYRP